VLSGYKFVSSSLIFVGARVFILENRIIFTCFFLQNTCSQAKYLHRLHWFLSEHVFSYWKLVSFLAVLFRTRVPMLQVCIVFAGFCRSTCSYTGSLEYLFSYWTFVPFTLGGFRSIFSHTLSLYRFSWFFQGMCSQATSLHRFQLVDIEIWPRENYRPIASHWQTLSPNVVSSEIRSHNLSTMRSRLIVSWCRIYLQIQGLVDFLSKRNYHHLKELISFNDTEIVCYTQ
jgi:hypothetical protein